MTRWILLVCALCSCGGGEEDEAKSRSQQCEQLRDHLVDLRLEIAKGSANELEQHRAAMKQVMGDQFIEACTTNTTDAQAACVLGAKDSQAAGECMSLAVGK